MCARRVYLQTDMLKDVDYVLTGPQLLLQLQDLGGDSSLTRLIGCQG